jgi:hypothetical protein
MEEYSDDSDVFERIAMHVQIEVEHSHDSTKDAFEV